MRTSHYRKRVLPKVGVGERLQTKYGLQQVKHIVCDGLSRTIDRWLCGSCDSDHVPAVTCRHLPWAIDCANLKDVRQRAHFAPTSRQAPHAQTSLCIMIDLVFLQPGVDVTLSTACISVLRSIVAVVFNQAWTCTLSTARTSSSTTPRRRVSPWYTSTCCAARPALLPGEERREEGGLMERSGERTLSFQFKLLSNCLPLGWHSSLSR